MTLAERASRTGECLAGLAVAAARYDRPGDFGRLRISITPAGPVTHESLAAYRDLGVDRLIVYPVGARTEAEVAQFIRDQAEVVLG